MSNRMLLPSCTEEVAAYWKALKWWPEVYSFNFYCKAFLGSLYVLLEGSWRETLYHFSALQMLWHIRKFQHNSLVTTDCKMTVHVCVLFYLKQQKWINSLCILEQKNAWLFCVWSFQTFIKLTLIIWCFL